MADGEQERIRHALVEAALSMESKQEEKASPVQTGLLRLVLQFSANTIRKVSKGEGRWSWFNVLGATH